MLASMTHAKSGPESAGDATTSFGFRDVDAAEKPSLVREVFESVADRYDLMNDLMSAGIHRRWKNEMVDWLHPQAGQRIVDVAGGTGDVAFRISERTNASASVVICDLTPAMLQVGRDRAIDHGVLSGISWVNGDAQALPFADRSFDAYTVAFGLRNVTALDRALAEARRVLKPGGRFLCLEFSHVVVPMLDQLYDLYSFRVLPLLGQIVARDRDAYQYLVESIRRFPPQGDLVRHIEGAGFDLVSYRNLTGGIAALHSAWRI